MSNNTAKQVGSIRVGPLKAIKRGKPTGEKDVHPVPRPFVKWAGGKRQLLDILKDAAPKTTDDISSPSSAGGVLFRAEAPQGHHLGYKSRAANCYKTIRDDVEALIRSLRTHEYEETYFMPRAVKTCLS